MYDVLGLFISLRNYNLYTDYLQVDGWKDHPSLLFSEALLVSRRVSLFVVIQLESLLPGNDCLPKCALGGFWFPAFLKKHFFLGKGKIFQFDLGKGTIFQFDFRIFFNRLAQPPPSYRLSRMVVVLLPKRWGKDGLIHWNIETIGWWLMIPRIDIYIYMDVSENSGTPKSSISS